jgi:hypothetical protein
VRIVIGEDLFPLREGLVRLLTAHDFEIAAAVASAPELLAPPRTSGLTLGSSTSGCRPRIPTGCARSCRHTARCLDDDNRRILAMLAHLDS